MCLHNLYEHTQLQADRQYTVYGIVYARQSTLQRTTHSDLHGLSVMDHAVDYEIGKTYSAAANIYSHTISDNQKYPAGFHRFMCIDDVRQYARFTVDNRGYDKVIAQFTVFGRDALAQGYQMHLEPRGPTIVWSKVTYVGCVEAQQGPPRFMPIPAADVRAMELMKEIIDGAVKPGEDK